MTGNLYIENLQRFEGKQVSVTDSHGNETTGILKAINHMHLNIVLEDSENVTIVKNIAKIVMVK